MNFIVPNYSRSKIEKAGKTISKHNETDKEFMDFIPVVDNWRASHAFPLNEIATIINNVLHGDDSIRFVQRLKRLESIINKLKKDNNTGLYRMQDLAGCRIIVSNIMVLKKYIDLVKNALKNSGQKIVREYDYINNPRENSGYRSYHIVVEYVNNNNIEYNGMFVEIQIRTKLENLWATTVEIIDFMMSKTLKAGTGDKIYMEFFKLVSGLFSIEEGTKIVKGISSEKKEIVNRIYEIDKKESIREKLRAYNNALNMFKQVENNQDNVYFLLHIDMRKKILNVTSYTNDAINLAIEEYHNYEKMKKNNGIDTLLVSGKNFDIIKESYPNYFIDTLQFLNNVGKLCMDYPEKPSIVLPMNSNSKKIIDLFDIYEYKSILQKDSYIVEEDGIGISNGNIINCPPWAATLDDAYLRFSGIIFNPKYIQNNKKINVIDMNCQGILVLQTGASFLIEKTNWSFISNIDSIFIKCKNGIGNEYLKLLISWFKSNICLWNVLCNFHSNTIANRRVYSELTFPILKNDKLIIGNCKQILKKEKEFIDQFNHMVENKNDVSSFTEKFNNDIREILIRNEKVYCEHYNINPSSAQIMKNDLGLKGYFVY